jgi:hypothetical protein
VPGTKFATVIPTPPPTNVRREIFDLVMISSLDGLGLFPFLSLQAAAIRIDRPIDCRARQNLVTSV